MSGKPQDRLRDDAVLDPNLFAYACDPRTMHACDHPSSLLTHPPLPDESSHRAFPSSAADWTTFIDPALQHHGDAGAVTPAGNMEPDHFNATGIGCDVGRLLAHLENESYTPPLPRRPTQPHSLTHAHQPHASMSPMPSSFGSLNSSAQWSRAPSPFIDADAAQFGSLAVDICSSAICPTSIDRTNHPYGSFHDPQRWAPSPFMASSSPSGSLDGSFNAGHAVSHIMACPVALSPMPTTLGQPTPGLPGTPDFEIWHAPGPELSGDKPEQASLLRSTNLSSDFRPPALNIQKPALTSSNRLILELDPEPTAKAKALAESPRPRLPPRKSSVAQSIPQTPRMQGSQATETPAQQTETTSLRGSTGIRLSRERIPAEAWEQFKTIIRALYLEERKPLREVMKIMAEKYGFQATPKMYKTQFSQWGFAKNNTEGEVKRLLSMKFQRDAKGKISRFMRNGRVVNLGSYLKRKGVTEYDLVDFELSTDLPAHICCRTPTPPPALKSPDTMRVQEVVVGNIRKVFLYCRQIDIETKVHIDWDSYVGWASRSSELLLQANSFFETRDVERGGDCLMRAFKQLEMDLSRLSPQGVMELVLAMINRDPGMVTALCKYLSAYSTFNLNRSHPLRLIFSCLYEMQQKHGAETLSELLFACISPMAEELEAVYGRRHPYVASTWADLAQFYNQRNAEHLGKVVLELRHLRRQIERQHGLDSAMAVVYRYVLLQLQYYASPHSELTKQIMLDSLTSLRRMGVLYRIEGSEGPKYCFHSSVNPSTKRCRRRYAIGDIMCKELLGVGIHSHFPEDPHTEVHALNSHEAWAGYI